MNFSDFSEKIKIVFREFRILERLFEKRTLQLCIECQSQTIPKVIKFKRLCRMNFSNIIRKWNSTPTSFYSFFLVKNFHAPGLWACFHGKTFFPAKRRLPDFREMENARYRLICLFFFLWIHFKASRQKSVRFSTFFKSVFFFFSSNLFFRLLQSGRFDFWHTIPTEKKSRIAILCVASITNPLELEHTSLATDPPISL